MITRVVMDIVHNEPLTDRQQRNFAVGADEFLKGVVCPQMKVKFDQNDFWSFAHTHDSNPDEACVACFNHSRDGRS